MPSKQGRWKEFLGVSNWLGPLPSLNRIWCIYL